MLSAIFVAAAIAGNGAAPWPSLRRDGSNSGAAPGPAHVTRLQLDPKWTYAADSRITSSPTVAGGLVFVGTWSGDVLALDERTGMLVWRAVLGAGSDWFYGGPRGVIGSVAVSNDVVYAVSGSCVAEALDAATGRTVWRTSVCDVAEHDDIYASPVVVGGKVLIGIDMLGDSPTDRGRELALSASTGKISWTMYPERYDGTGTGISATPAIDAHHNVAYIGTGNPTPATAPPPGPDAYSDSMLAVNVATGEVLWTFGPVNPHDTHDFDFFASPNRFIVGAGSDARWAIGEANKNGTYYAVDARTGAELWRRFVMAEPIGTSAVAGDTIFVTAYGDRDDAGMIAALRTSDGAVMWSRDTAGMYEAPAVWGDVVFATEASGWLDAFSAGDGAPLGRWPLAGALHGRGPSVADGTLFVAAGTRLHAYSLAAQVGTR